jgi:hypothetical protein
LLCRRLGLLLLLLEFLGNDLGLCDLGLDLLLPAFLDNSLFWLLLHIRL